MPYGDNTDGADYQGGDSVTPAEEIERRRQKVLALQQALRGGSPQAMPQGLDRQRAVGLLSILTGNRQLSGAGEALVGNANQQEQFQRQTPGIDLSNQLKQQEVEAGSRSAAAQQNPATRAAYQGVLSKFGMNVDPNTPASVMQGIMPVVEKGYAVDQAAQSRREAARLRAGDPEGPENIAQAIINGDQPPILTGMYGKAPLIRAALAKQGFNLSSAQQEWNATQRHLATMNGPQQTRLQQAVDFTSQSVDNVEQLYNQWKKSGVSTGSRLFNSAALSVAKQLPGQAGADAQALEGQINDLVGELSNVYMGGNSPTDQAIKLAKANLSADWNEATFTKAIQQVRNSLRMRQNAMRSAPTLGVGGSRYDKAPAPGAAQPQGDGGMVDVIAPDGTAGQIPAGNLDKALARGFKRAGR
jgi:hypothetical protein